ncbi:ABC transporter permease [Ligilactobacillus pobuzihii]|uniref:Putative hemin transport system permease protein HrtB n=1 Tax=Ligilactobacillus pobuzihii TaxID=449659 RepID=A0A0R2L606_9LACO|nr:ABC transporter permease [Ligilactobacillus pobuzihii]KRK09789.1 ABC superfamily ATP binding cassette transporter, membrane protein [Ligilactobacillus pobuzihii E100301 = KCTC 13174]KRN96784.1 ABC superfamily ATP binding cassette transporter, membrane protein [Ligilactobacillus pobuzihii]GEN48645.1 ABC transporter permease [Ligilactobacillus pobuzihii]HIZ95880.1 ABC transporter permease [Candidatus Ligilactobacillus excrementavium]
MFLALKELKKEKIRSGLIVTMIVLIGYLIFILTSLALGLAQQNTDAINSWGGNRIALNSNSNVDMRQSFLTKDEVGTLSNKESLIGETSIVAKAKSHKQLAAVFVGLKSNEFIYKNIDLDSGRNVKDTHEIVADTAFRLEGYKLGSKVKLNDDKQKFTIVGFTKKAKMNVAPVVYGQLDTWQSLRDITGGPIASAIISKDSKYDNIHKGVKTYDKQQVIDKLPGYQAQTTTFIIMIGFLMVISLIIIAVFLYILTMQKLPNYAVLRVQGIPSKVLVMATIAQSFLLVITGLIVATLLTTATALVIPASVPMAFDIPVLGAVGAGLLVMAMIGGLIPIKSVLSVDPVSVIGG